MMILRVITFVMLGFVLSDAALALGAKTDVLDLHKLPLWQGGDRFKKCSAIFAAVRNSQRVLKCGPALEDGSLGHLYL